MQKITVGLLFAILRYELFGIELNEEQKESAALNIPQIMKLAKHHDLGHLCADALIKCGLASKDEELYKRIEKEKLSAIFRSVKMERELSLILSILNEAQIVHIPLKGSVIRSLYPEPFMRTSCDIDILIKEEDVERTTFLLQEKLKYTTDGERHFHDISLFSQSGIHLELHFSIKEKIENLDKVLEKVFDFASPIEEGSYTYRLTNEFLLFHIISHASYHFVKGGSGIKPFIDIYLLNKNMQLDKGIVLNLCRDAEIDKFLFGVEELSAVWFEGREHSELTMQMESFILDGGVYGTDKNHAAAAQVKSGGRFKSILSLIFLPYDNLKILYPSLEGKKILLPFYWVRRWFRVIFKGRLGKGIRTIKTNATVSKESRDTTAELFSKLGL